MLRKIMRNEKSSLSFEAFLRAEVRAGYLKNEKRRVSRSSKVLPYPWQHFLPASFLFNLMIKERGRLLIDTCLHSNYNFQVSNIIPDINC